MPHIFNVWMFFKKGVGLVKTSFSVIEPEHLFLQVYDCVCAWHVCESLCVHFGGMSKMHKVPKKLFTYGTDELPTGSERVSLHTM